MKVSTTSLLLASLCGSAFAAPITADVNADVNADVQARGLLDGTVQSVTGPTGLGNLAGPGGLDKGLSGVADQTGNGLLGRGAEFVDAHVNTRSAVDGLVPKVAEVDGLLSQTGAVTGPLVHAPVDAKVNSRNVDTAVDADIDAVVDAKVTAAVDAKVDAAVDAKVTAAVDAVVDAKVTAVVDAKVDAVVDAKVTAVVDAKVDAVVDAKVTAAVDAKVDAAVDAKVDTAVDAKVDAVDAKVTAVVDAKVDAVVDAKVTAAVDAKVNAKVNSRNLHANVNALVGKLVDANGKAAVTPLPQNPPVDINVDAAVVVPLTHRTLLSDNTVQDTVGSVQSAATGADATGAVTSLTPEVQERIAQLQAEIARLSGGPTARDVVGDAAGTVQDVTGVDVNGLVSGTEQKLPLPSL